MYMQFKNFGSKLEMKHDITYCHIIYFSHLRSVNFFRSFLGFADFEEKSEDSQYFDD